MQKSNPPERVLRLAGVTGFPAHATDTQKVGALQLKGRAGDVVIPTRPLLYNPQLMRQACGYNSTLDTRPLLRHGQTLGARIAPDIRRP